MPKKYDQDFENLTLQDYADTKKHTPTKPMKPPTPTTKSKTHRPVEVIPVSTNAEHLAFELEITGVMKNKVTDRSSNLLEHLIALSAVIKCPIDDDWIEKCTRTGPSNIVVRFRTIEKRNHFLLLASRFNEKNPNWKELLADKPVNVVESNIICVRQNRSDTLRRLYKGARIICRERGYKQCWFDGDQVFVRAASDKPKFLVRLDDDGIVKLATTPQN